MEENDLQRTIVDSMRYDNKKNIQLPERDELLTYLHRLPLIIGRADAMHIHCNAFLSEAIQLLINAIFLYEDGLFDCASYSVRQASEVVNSMLYLSQSKPEALKEWAAKKHFPVNSRLKKHLERLSCGYKEIKSLVPEFFERHDELTRKLNKIIHKQGFDAFYRFRYRRTLDNDVQKKEMKLFIMSLKYALGNILIMFIILDPISLALADEEITLRLHFNPMTEPVDIHYFKEYLGLDDVIDRIKSSDFYRELTSYFADKEVMLPAVAAVVRDEAWDVNALHEIEKQIDLLDIYQRFMFFILRNGLRVSNFYFNNGLAWYFTSIRSNARKPLLNFGLFEQYSNPHHSFNQPCENTFVSAIVMYNDHLILEHNEPFTCQEIQMLKAAEKQSIQDLEEINEMLADFVADRANPQNPV